MKTKTTRFETQSRFRKLLGVLALLLCGVWAMQAQVVSITQGGVPVSGHHCMPIGNQGTEFQANVNLANLSSTATNNIVYTWTTMGGIEVVSREAGTITVMPKAGITYDDFFSKYAQGRLRVTARVQHRFLRRIIYPCYPHDTTWVYHYYSSQHTAEILIRKQFSDLTGNLITGPECVRVGQRVTFSVAPWISLYQLGTVGFDEYTWVIPPGVAQGVLHRSADRSSVTFVVGNNFDGRTISVNLGACNVGEGNPRQEPLTLTLRAEPGVPELYGDASFAYGMCLPFGAGEQTLTIANADPTLTYIWSNLDGWADAPTDTLGSNHKLTFTPGNDARHLRLSVEGSCGVQTHDLRIERSLSAEINQIVAISDGICVEANRSAQFKVTNTDKNMPITWAVAYGTASGWDISPAMVNFSQPYIRAGSGKAIISARAGCGSLVIEQEIRICADIPIILSAERRCFAESKVTETFSVFNPNPNTIFEWCFPSEWRAEGAYNRGTITLIMTTSGELRVRIKDSWDDDDAGWSNVIQIGLVPETPELDEIACVPSGMLGRITLSVSNPSAGATYEWRIPEEFGIMTYDSDSTAPTIEVYTLGNVGEFTVSVRALSSCGNSEWVESNQIVIEALPFWIMTVERGLPINRQRVLSVYTDDWGIDFDWFGARYTWLVDGEFFAEGYGYDMFFEVQFPVSSRPNGTASVIITTADGCEHKLEEISWGTMAPANAPIQAQQTLTHPQVRMSPTTIVFEENLNIVVAPNPARDRVAITLPEIGNSSIFLMDMNGRMLKRMRSDSLNVEIDVSNIPNGTYIISVKQNGNRYTEQLIIRR